MERIKNLNTFQKVILVILAVMLVVFAVVYAVTTSRVGYLYKDTILVPGTVGSDTVYTGKVNGEEAVFTVTADKTVTFRYGEKTYGPFTAKKDPTAVPEDDDLAKHMTGVEIRQGEELFFRGGVLKSGGTLMLYNEDGSWADFGVYATMSDGTTVDSDGNVVDTMSPKAGTILKLMKGPELTHKGNWTGWLCGVFLSIVTAVSILFVDELFRWNLSFQIRNAHRAEPSDWEIAGRYIGWVAIPIMALVVYIMGLS